MERLLTFCSLSLNLLLRFDLVFPFRHELSAFIVHGRSDAAKNIKLDCNVVVEKWWAHVDVKSKLKPNRLGRSNIFQLRTYMILSIVINKKMAIRSSRTRGSRRMKSRIVTKWTNLRHAFHTAIYH